METLILTASKHLSSYIDAINAAPKFRIGMLINYIEEVAEFTDSFSREASALDIFSTKKCLSELTTLIVLETVDIPWPHWMRKSIVLWLAQRALEKLQKRH